VNRNDLTLSENFSKYLGSFWTEIFDNGLFANAIGDYSSHELAQIYKDLVVAVNSCSAESVPIYRRESVYPVIISRSDIDDNTTIPKYGSGLLYGQQTQVSPSTGEVVLFGAPYKEKDLYFIDLPDDVPFIEDNSLVAMERLYGGSILWINGVDFFIKGKRLVFKKNPFSLSAFPKRATRKNGLDDVETVIWLCEVDFDKNDIFRNFGSIFSGVKTSSEDYKNVCKSFLSLVSTGASINRVDELMSSAASSPMIKEEEETIIAIYSSVPEDCPPLVYNKEGRFIETDKNLYSVLSKQVIKDSVFVGETFAKGFALTSAIDIIDTKKRQDWWKDLVTIPAADLFADDDIKFLSFPNKNSDVTFKTIGSSVIARFDITGDKKSVDTFWKNMDKEAREKNLVMSDLISEVVNPAEFFVNNMANSIILPIIIDLAQVDDVPFLFSSISSSINKLKGVFPVYAFVYVMLNIRVSDEYDMSEYSEDSFDSWHISSPIQGDTMNCGEKQFAIENVLVKYRSKCSI